MNHTPIKKYINLPLQGAARGGAFAYPGRCHRAEINWAFSPKRLPEVGLLHTRGAAAGLK